MGTHSSFTGTLHGVGYTERDIAAISCCAKTAVGNVIVKFNVCDTFPDYKMSCRLRKTMHNAAVCPSPRAHFATIA